MKFKVRISGRYSVKLHLSLCTLELAASLDRVTFKKLFEEHYSLLCNYLYGQTRDRELAEEVAQKTFVKLWDKRADLTVTSSAKSYLFQSARNTLIDHFRAQKNKDSHNVQYMAMSPNSTTIEVDEGEDSALAHTLMWAVDQLKPKTREIFLLSKKEGLTYEEIADFLEISKRTVEYNMKNALLQLRELLKGKIDLP